LSDLRRRTDTLSGIHQMKPVRQATLKGGRCAVHEVYLSLVGAEIQVSMHDDRSNRCDSAKEKDQPAPAHGAHVLKEL
jgi:hypothetical protein